MAKYLLDTNICVFFLRGKFNIDTIIKQKGLKNCNISEITIAELLYGAECDTNMEENKKQVNEFVKKMNVIPIFNVLPVYAKEKKILRQTGNIIDDFDILIGATAIAGNMILVTDNGKHLSHLSNIKIENWVER
ncbi:MAG: type II toxin-antitoxin system VapC family toxin [Prevotellaceae bacterium]|jgi:tRNA(fMet)-specific endonuclease VapC|nr:type II toxin-antitoxin system VapC family toxin [Prevotellaceae bacterium]